MGIGFQSSRGSFQSAPLTDVRGDVEAIHDATKALVFQSAPLTDVRGDCMVEGY